jgi:hypothetical protein
MPVARLKVCRQVTSPTPRELSEGEAALPMERKITFAHRATMVKCHESAAPAVLLLKQWLSLPVSALDMAAFSSLLSSRQDHQGSHRQADFNSAMALHYYKRRLCHLDHSPSRDGGTLYCPYYIPLNMSFAQY